MNRRRLITPPPIIGGKYGFQFYVNTFGGRHSIFNSGDDYEITYYPKNSNGYSANMTVKGSWFNSNELLNCDSPDLFIKKIGDNEIILYDNAYLSLDYIIPGNIDYTQIDQVKIISASGEHAYVDYGNNTTNIHIYPHYNVGYSLSTQSFSIDINVFFNTSVISLLVLRL